MQQLLTAAVISPLAGFLITGIAGKKLPRTITGLIGSLSVLISFVCALMLFSQLRANAAPITLDLFNWLNSGSFSVNFSLTADRLSVLMMLIITGVGFLIHVYSAGYMSHDEGFHKFFSYLNLFIFFMLLLVLGSNLLILFFGWEGVGLCSYLLIGFWYQNEDYGKAARKAFVMNRIGDLGLLLGIFLLFTTFGTIDFEGIRSAMANKPFETDTVTAACILLFIGAMGKSAQIPLYTWLPDAMAGPTPVSALIHAATMVTAGIYLVVRTNFMFAASETAQMMLMVIGLATSVFSALIGLKQNDIKKVLAYSTVSQLGLLFVSLGVGAYTAAMFHLTTHAFFKALLFLGSGSVIHAVGGEQDIRKMGGLRKAIPVTYWTFLIGTLAIVGFPLMSGFFSKDEILASIFSKNPLVWGITLASVMVTALYMMRLLLVVFHGSFRGTDDQKHHLHESPVSMTLPLMVLAILSIFGGVLNLPHFMGESSAHGLKHWLQPVYAMGVDEVHHPEGSMEWILMAAAVGVFVLAFLYARSKYISKNEVPEADEQITGAGKVLNRKFYVDEVYDALIVNPANQLGEMLHRVVDNGIIDRLVNLFGQISVRIANLIRYIQSGNIEYYLFGMIAGLILLVLFTIWKF